jgi:DNA-binding NtrC family response regulator
LKKRGIKEMNVIIVDDDKALLKSLGILLMAEGYSVKTFADALEACGYISKGGPLDVLIVDYAMPVLNGDLFIEKVKAYLSRNCKIILISGHTELVEPLDLESMNVTKFISKPLDLKKLYEVIKS